MRAGRADLDSIPFGNARLKIAGPVMTSPPAESPNRVPAASVPMIEALGVHLTLASSAGPVNILKGIDLTIARGEAVALVGPSGSGKSTFIRCINRLVEPTEGQVFLDDVELTGLSRSALRRQRRFMGMIFQEYNLVERLTVMENVLSGRLGYVSFLQALLPRFPPSDVA